MSLLVRIHCRMASRVAAGGKGEIVGGQAELHLGLLVDKILG
jgi:hypothetical protein